MWEQIRSNQIKSMMLVVALGLLLLVLGYMLGWGFADNGIAGLIIALVIWFFMNLFAYFQGGSMVLAISGARKIGPDDHPRLWNVVEEMKIASGLEKMPDVYIIDDPALNAFATGRDPNRSAVAVTSGLLAKLNRDELQGVIAHEMSHIKNRDVLVMALASVLLGTIVMLAWYGSRAMMLGGGGRRKDSSGGGGGAIIVVLALVLMILAPIFAQLIYFAVSRRREYLADASGALYTRYPEGLASALEKLGESTGQLKSANQATAPMYITNPFKKKGREATDPFGTHPPISERIRILRQMGGVSYSEYETAYEQVHGGGGVMPKSALALAGASIKAVTPPADTANEPDMLERTRETQDLMWRMSNYKMIDCECGARIRVPPSYPDSEVKCPHCGRMHQI